MTESGRSGRESSRVILRRMARTLSLVFLGITGLIVLGEPAVDWSSLTVFESAQMVLFAIGCLALMAAWRWPAWGGLVAFLAVAAFVLAEIADGGRPPRGWMFGLMAISAALFLVSGWMRPPRAAGGAA